MKLSGAVSVKANPDSIQGLHIDRYVVRRGQLLAREISIYAGKYHICRQIPTIHIFSKYIPLLELGKTCKGGVIMSLQLTYEHSDFERMKGSRTAA